MFRRLLGQGRRNFASLSQKADAATLEQPKGGECGFHSLIPLILGSCSSSLFFFAVRFVRRFLQANMIGSAGFFAYYMYLREAEGSDIDWQVKLLSR